MQELAGEKHKIISCGGGMAMRKENVALMQQNGVVVLLTAKPETILSRVQQDKGRPILQGNMNVAYICELLQQRSPPDLSIKMQEKLLWLQMIGPLRRLQKKLKKI